MLRSLWRLRLPLICATVVFGLWDTALLKPARLFMVLTHEMLHVVATYATGGTVTQTLIRMDETGRTVSVGEYTPIVAQAGYLGSALLGALLIYASTRPGLLRVLVVLLGVASLLIATRFAADDGLAWRTGVTAAALLLTAALGFSQEAMRVGGTWLGVMFCAYVAHDFGTDLLVQPQITDAGLLARHLQHPGLAMPIAVAWCVVLVPFVAVALWRVERHGQALETATGLGGVAEEVIPAGAAAHSPGLTPVPAEGTSCVSSASLAAEPY
ncbi:MAG: M50 family metallopeptidase [Candidatus Latescibacterota bacterium]